MEQQMWPPCPAWLEDEAWFIETAGEMPEVALAEVLADLPELSPDDDACLKAAAARGYLRIIKRDLDFANVGQGHFRGLERARENLERLAAFRSRRGVEPPREAFTELGEMLLDFLDRENRRLAGGAAYTYVPAHEAGELAARLGLALPAPLQKALAEMAGMAAPDFLGLKALKALESPHGAFKRMITGDDQVIIEVLDRQGNPVAAAGLNPAFPAGGQTHGRSRVEQVWGLVALPEYKEP